MHKVPVKFDWFSLVLVHFCSDDFCMGCQRDVDEDETVNPVTWEELLRLCDECSQLQSIFADHVAEVAATDRSDPIVWMNTLTKAVSLYICSFISLVLCRYLCWQGDKDCLSLYSRWPNGKRHKFIQNRNRIVVQQRRKRFINQFRYSRSVQWRNGEND